MFSTCRGIYFIGLLQFCFLSLSSIKHMYDLRKIYVSGISY